MGAKNKIEKSFLDSRLFFQSHFYSQFNCWLSFFCDVLHLIQLLTLNDDISFELNIKETISSRNRFHLLLNPFE